MLFYLSWTVLAIWLILKLTGVIKTPFWLEYGVPIGSLIIGIFGLYRDVLENVQKLSIGLTALSTDFKHFNIKVDLLDSKVNQLDLSVNHLNLKVDHIDKDVESLKHA